MGNLDHVFYFTHLMQHVDTSAMVMLLIYFNLFIWYDMRNWGNCTSLFSARRKLMGLAPFLTSRPCDIPWHGKSNVSWLAELESGSVSEELNQGLYGTGRSCLCRTWSVSMEWVPTSFYGWVLTSCYGWVPTSFYGRVPYHMSPIVLFSLPFSFFVRVLQSYVSCISIEW